MNLNDQVFLKMLVLFFEQQSEAWGIKTTDSVFYYANAAYCDLVGMKGRDITGLNDSEIPCDTAEFADEFSQQDRVAESSENGIIALDIHNFSTGFSALTFNKSPLYLPSGQLFGTTFHGQTATHNLESIISAHSRIKTNASLSIEIGTQMRPVLLTELQSLVLFFLLRGRKTKEIALYLRRSPRSVDHVVERLVDKFSRFGVSNRQQLIDAAMTLGYFDVYPQSLFSQSVSVMITPQ